MKEVESGTGMGSGHKAQCHTDMRGHGWAQGMLK